MSIAPASAQRHFQSDILQRVGATEPMGDADVTCVTVCHNEVRIIRHFIDHYRTIGCGHFLIVDDHSDDGTFEFLEAQDDVTLFRPINGARFSDNVANWRHQLLDHYCAGRWVTLPDVDEFMYFKDMPRKLAELAVGLDSRREEALLAVMIDMYGDQPLSTQAFSGERPLDVEFPYFDGQGEPPSGIRIVSQPSRFLKRFPTPQVCFMGGVRERLFFQKGPLTGLQKWLLAHYAHARRPLNPNALHRLQNRMVRAATKGGFSQVPFVLNKFALLKWQAGTRFNRAPHAISRDMKVSEGLAAFLHFKFYKGQTGMEYTVGRGQHAGQSTLYRQMLGQDRQMKASPVGPESRKFEGIESLSGILR